MSSEKLMDETTAKALEREALALIRFLQQKYLEQRDMRALFPAMEANTSWIGTGADEFCYSLADAKLALNRELSEHPGPFVVTGAAYQARALSETVCVVYGSFCARPEAADVEDLDHRLTALCVQTPEGLCLAHLHLSQPDLDQENGRYYVQRGVKTDREALQNQAAEFERQLSARSRELLSLTQNIPGGMHCCRYDPYFTLVNVSQGFLTMFGYTREELREQFNDRFVEMLDPQDRPHVMANIKEQLKQGNTVELEYRVRCKDGTLLWIMDKGNLALGADGTPYFYCLLLDITKERQAREELRLSLERHQIIMDQTTDIIFEWDILQDTLRFSSNWLKKFGYQPIQKNISQSIPSSKNIHSSDMSAFVKIMKDTVAGVPYSETEFRIRDTLGIFTWCRIRATAQYDEVGRPVKAVGVIVDIDADKKQRQRLLEQARHDGLTGLLNKAAVQQAVETLMAQIMERQGVLLIIDLDDFKGINDCYGHLCGDTVLVDVAAVLKQQFRAGDVIARIGGDEFLAFLPGASITEAKRRALEIVQQLEALAVFGCSGRVSCSVGAAAWPQDAGSFLELYHCADLALYQVKSRTKRSFACYTPALSNLQRSGQGMRSAVSTVIDSDTQMANEHLSQQCCQLLYQTIEPEEAIEQILEMVGRAYDASRVYVMERSADGLTCSNTLEWCNNGIAPRQQQLQTLDWLDYKAAFGSQAVVGCKDNERLSASLRQWLERQNADAMLQYALQHSGEIWGYMGVSIEQTTRQWTQGQMETLVLASHIVSIFLMQLRLAERLIETAQA